MQAQIFRLVKSQLALHGITQVQIAKELGITPLSVNQALKGRCESRRVKEAVAAKLGFDPWQDAKGNDDRTDAS